MINTFLSFIVCDELYAVNVTKVLKVLEIQNITRVPDAPAYVRGIINFRGDIVPVFESRIKFNLPLRPDEASYVIVVFDLSHNSETFLLGAIVDRVKDVILIDDQEIKPVPTWSTEFNTEFLEGIYKLGETYIMLLDVEKVFTSDEFTTLTEANAITTAD